MKRLVQPRPLGDTARNGSFGSLFDGITVPLLIVPLLVVLVATVWLCPAAIAQQGDDELPEPDVRSTLVNTMGVEGTYFLHYDGARLSAIPADQDAPFVVRIVDVVEEEGSTVYELRYISSQPGNFDLRNYLVADDGQIVGPLLPAFVTIRELLMPDHDGALWQLPEPEIVPPVRYKLVLVMMATIWMIPIVWMLLKRTCSTANKSNAPLAVNPTLVDQ